MKSVVAVLFVVASAYSLASSETPKYISVVECGTEDVARAHDIGKIYEPYSLVGIEDLAFLLDKAIVAARMGVGRSVVDENGIVRWMPAVALSLGDGWLAGSFHKTYGGELVFINARKEAKLILDKPVFDLFKTEAGIIVITARSLLGDEKNDIYLVRLIGGGFDVVKMFSLPAVPVSAWMLPNGGVLVNLEQSSFMLSSELELSRVKCNSELKGS
jgi:hypothetical protein